MENTSLRQDADAIISAAISAVQPDAAVQRALSGMSFDGKVVLIAIGKAAWQMAKAASDVLGYKIDNGVVVTKYEHVMGKIPNCVCYEAGHPVPDENSFKGTQAAIDAVTNLTEKDTVLFLISGGGSALFEKPLVSGEELQDITNQLLASGPACPDHSTCAQAEEIVQKYKLKLSDTAKELLKQETPKSLNNVETQINGSVRELCSAASVACKELGYEPVLLTDQLCCQAKEAGSFLASVLKTHNGSEKNLAFLAGGETIVKLTGKGKGGRNQELALAAAAGIDGINGAVFSVGSDGTDGPTDAAGGYVDGTSAAAFREKAIDPSEVLAKNDAYNALKEIGGLIMTGPTGTNVNDVAIALLRK